MPKHQATYDEHFILHYPNGKPAKNLKYRITTKDGKVHQGTSDKNGKTEIYSKDVMTALDITILQPN